MHNKAESNSYRWFYTYVGVAILCVISLNACIQHKSVCNDFDNICQINECIKEGFVSIQEGKTIQLETNIRDGQVSPDGAWLATVSVSNLSVYRIDNDQFVLEKSIKIENGTNLRWSPDGNLIAFGEMSSHLSIYDFYTGKVIDKVYVGVSYSPHFEWSLDSQWIMAMAMQPSLDPTFLAAKMYRVNEGKLILDREFHFPQDMIGKKGFAVNFDWNRNSPETVQALIRTYTDITFFDEQENQYHYFDFDNLIEFGYLGTYWLENNEFLIINNSSDDLITIYFVTGDKITHTQKAEIIESPEIYGIHSSVLDDSRKVFVSYGLGHESINIHCIQDQELIYVGGIQLPNTQRIGDFLIINSVKDQIYTYSRDNKEIHIFDLDEFLKN